MAGIVGQVIALLEPSQEISSTEVARVAGISRQAAHKQLRRMVGAGVLSVTGQARACRYTRVEAAVAPLRSHLQVATAGSLYRLSARLLLDGVRSGEVTLDFTGVFDVGDEFLEEVFALLAPWHAQVQLKVVRLPARFAPRFFELARQAREASARGEDAPVVATALGTDRRRRRA